MSRAYLRLDPAFYERKYLDQKYPPGAIAAYVGCLCLAETQPLRGRFRDRRVLKVLLGPLSRWVDFLVEHGDLIEQSAYPHLYVDGWDEWQEGDWKVAERVARLRGRTHRVTPVVTLPVTMPVTPARIAEAVGGGGANGGGGSPFNGSPQRIKDLTDDERERAIQVNRAIIHDPSATSATKRAAEHALAVLGVGLA